MKSLLISSILLTLFSLSDPIAQASPVVPDRIPAVDSVGVEKKGGKRFIIHRVNEGQTLYAIARKYGRSVADIRAANPDLTESVRSGQLVKIPAANVPASKPEQSVKREATNKQKVNQKPATAEAKSEKSADKEAKKADDPARAGIHVVEPSQTLYSLASRYGVSQADLRKWNNLSGNNVLIGQALIVSEKAYQVRMPSTPAPTAAAKTPDASPREVSPREASPRVVHPTEPHSATPTAESHPTTTSESKPERRTDSDATTHPKNESETPNRPVATPPTSDNRPPAKATDTEAEIELPRPGNDAPMPTRGRRISASGVAEMIEGADDSGKYLALHRTAPIGTLVQVRNEFNNQSLWVKVVGRLPNTGINDKILIKLSTQAFSKLSPQDQRFRAEVSYIIR